MSIEKNECVIATTWDNAVVAELHTWIATLTEKEQELFVTAPTWVNNSTTFFLAPGGSKKGWPEDREATELREKFIEKIRTFDYEDASSPIEWVEVGFGEFGQKVLRGNCHNRYTQEEYCNG